MGIQHKKGVPYWPQSNGEVEIVCIAQLERRDYWKAVQDFLFQYQATPHPVTGISPTKLLMGRKLRDKLPKVEFSSDGYWQQQLRQRDACSKLQQKEYADRTQGAKYSDIRSGDKVLLKQACDSKL